LFQSLEKELKEFLHEMSLNEQGKLNEAQKKKLALIQNHLKIMDNEMRLKLQQEKEIDQQLQLTTQITEKLKLDLQELDKRLEGFNKDNESKNQ